MDVATQKELVQKYVNSLNNTGVKTPATLKRKEGTKMLKQTFIAYVKNENNTVVTFERFSCKRAETVKKHMNTLFENELYRICNPGAKTIEIRDNENAIVAAYEI